MPNPTVIEVLPGSVSGTVEFRDVAPCGVDLRRFANLLDWQDAAKTARIVGQRRDPLRWEVVTAHWPDVLFLFAGVELMEWIMPKARLVTSEPHMPAPKEEPACEECWGTGHYKGYGAPCSRGCASRPVKSGLVEHYGDKSPADGKIEVCDV